jgi:hypothetical protein
MQNHLEVEMNDDLNDLIEWRWVDDKGRAMTSWKRGYAPPVLDLTDGKGEMRVEVRITPNVA